MKLYFHLIRVLQISPAYITTLNFSLDNAKSLSYYMMNNNGPRIEPWGTPVDVSSILECVSSISTYCFILHFVKITFYQF